jgi:hypothetical protein
LSYKSVVKEKHIENSVGELIKFSIAVVR